MIRVLMSSVNQLSRDGITNVMLNLIENMDINEYHFDVVGISNPTEEIRSRIEKFGQLIVVKRSFRHPLRFIKQYKKVCKGYDIVHVHGNSATMSLEVLAAKMAGVKVRVAHCHNSTCKYKTIDKLLRVPFYALCNTFLACGMKAGRWLYGNRPFEVINNGIKTELFAFSSDKRTQIRNELGIEEKQVIINVGNFVEAKNHTFLVDVFEILHRDNPEYYLILVGSERGNRTIKRELEQECIRRGLGESIFFTGSVSNVEDYLSASDLVVMPSLFEGLPLTLIEEQANGLSCLCADTITEDVNLTGNVSFLSLDTGKEKWAKEIKEFFGQSPNIVREQKSNKAIANIKENGFDIEQSINVLSTVYQKKVGGKE